MHVCMYVRTYVRMYVRVCVCMWVRVCIYIYIYSPPQTRPQSCVSCGAVSNRPEDPRANKMCWSSCLWPES